MNDLIIQENNNVSILFNQKKKEIRELFAPELSDTQFDYFMQMAIRVNANPFLREIYALKTRYKNKQDQWIETLSVFCGRDYYRRVAQEQPTYNGHVSSAVYKNDTLTINNGVVNHVSNLANRGELIGSYCTVYRKDLVVPITVFVNYKEYAKSFGTWLTMGATMIDKVAESQGFRKAYQGLFAGTYDESEQWQNAEVVPNKTENKPKETVKTELTDEKVSNIVSKFKEIQTDLDLETTSIEVRENAKKEVTILCNRLKKNHLLSNEQLLSFLSEIGFDDLREDLETFFTTCLTQTETKNE